MKRETSVSTVLRRNGYAPGGHLRSLCNGEAAIWNSILSGFHQLDWRKGGGTTPLTELRWGHNEKDRSAHT